MQHIQKKQWRTPELQNININKETRMPPKTKPKVSAPSENGNAANGKRIS